MRLGGSAFREPNRARTNIFIYVCINIHIYPFYEIQQHEDVHMR